MHVIDAKNWVNNYADYLYRIAMLKLNNKEEAEDIVQETFLSAFKHMAGFKGESSEKTWLTAILNNKIIDHFRKNKPEKPFAYYIEQTEASFQQHFFDTSNFGRWINKITLKNSSAKHTDSLLLDADFETAMKRCLDHMPDRLKQVFLAKYFDEVETKAICAQFNISDANFWVIIFRAKTIFRACLEKSSVI